MRLTPRPYSAITFILPVQSGSTRVLGAMRRTYTREEYLEKISWIRAARRLISVTTDIIVGFPGETENDFEQSVTLLDAVGYDGVYAFTYSPRPNTTASTMPDAIPEEEKYRRLAVLQDRQRQIQIERNNKLVGSALNCSSTPTTPPAGSGRAARLAT